MSHTAQQMTALRAERAAKALSDYAKHCNGRDSDHYWLVALDALRFVLDSDISEEYGHALRECQVNEEGFPLNDDGDVIRGADREFIPAHELPEERAYRAALKLYARQQRQSFAQYARGLAA